MLSLTRNPACRFLLSVASCLWIANVAFGADAEDKATLDNLRTLWDHQRTAIKSVVIHYRSVYRPAKPDAAREDVLKLIDAAHPIDNEETQKRLITSLDTTLAGKENVWASNVFTLRGRDTRVDSTYEARVTSHVLVGDNELRSRPITPQGQLQIDLYARGGSHIHVPSIADFNYLPGAAQMKVAKVEPRDLSDDRQQIVLRAGGIELTAAKDSGFIVKLTSGSPALGTGEDIFQFKSTTHSADTIFPTVILQAKYRSNKLHIISMSMIDKVEINQPIPDETFFVVARAGDIVVDQQAKPENVINVVYDTKNVLGGLAQ